MINWFILGALMLLTAAAYCLIFAKKNASIKPSAQGAISATGWVFFGLSLIIMLLTPGVLKPLVIWLGLVSIVYMSMIFFTGIVQHK